MASKGKRLQYVDAVKGIAILCIVFYHLLAPCGFKTVFNHLTELFLAAFFFYSGFFYRPGKRSIGENIRNRAKALMVPFFKYSLCFWGAGSIYLVATKNETWKEAFLCLRNFFAGCIWNRVIQDWFKWEYYSLGRRYFFLADFWFLLSMLFASIIFFLIADKALRSSWTMLVTLLVLYAATGICMRFSVALPYNIHLAPYWASFMVFGAFVGSRKLTELPPSCGNANYVPGAVLTAAGIVLAFVKEPSLNLFRGSFGSNEIVSMLLCIAAALPFIWGIGILFAQMERSGVRIKEAAWFGTHSLNVYLFHMFYAWIICIITGFSVRYEEPVSTRVLVSSLLTTAAVIILCLLHGFLVTFLQGRRKNAAGQKKQ